MKRDPNRQPVIYPPDALLTVQPSPIREALSTMPVRRLLVLGAVVLEVLVIWLWTTADRNAARIRAWHPGQLALVWVVVVAILWLLREIARDESTYTGVALWVARLLALGFVGALTAAIATTWLWVAGRASRAR